MNTDPEASITEPDEVDNLYGFSDKESSLVMSRDGSQVYT